MDGYIDRWIDRWIHEKERVTVASLLIREINTNGIQMCLPCCCAFPERLAARCGCFPAADRYSCGCYHYCLRRTSCLWTSRRYDTSATLATHDTIVWATVWLITLMQTKTMCRFALISCHFGAYQSSQANARASLVLVGIQRSFYRHTTFWILVWRAMKN
jgi:hypothetical protein